MSAAVPATVAQGAAAQSRVARLLGSSVGLKLVMAVTGVILSGFVLGHMTGNLLAFQGPEAIRKYALGLRAFPAVLWGVRLGLLAAVALHIWAYWLLSRRSWTARPQGYREIAFQESSWASRSMRWTGPLLLAFIVYHLLHMTTGTVHPDFRGDFDVYHNLVVGLRVAWVGGFYVLATGALALHLWHGIWSLFQSLGISQPRHQSLARRLATVFTIIVCGGFAAVPLAILADFLK